MVDMVMVQVQEVPVRYLPLTSNPFITILFFYRGRYQYGMVWNMISLLETRYRMVDYNNKNFSSVGLCLGWYRYGTIGTSG
jgi:hypothetical protein